MWHCFSWASAINFLEQILCWSNRLMTEWVEGIEVTSTSCVTGVSDCSWGWVSSLSRCVCLLLGLTGFRIRQTVAFAIC
jgi:hypothetical protein